MQCSRRGPHPLGHHPMSWEGTRVSWEGTRVLERVPGLGTGQPCLGAGVGDMSRDKAPISRDKSLNPGTNPCPLGQDPGAPWLPWHVGHRAQDPPLPNPGRIDPPGAPCPAHPDPRARRWHRGGSGWVGTPLAAPHGLGHVPWAPGTAPGTIPSRISVPAVPGGVSGAHRGEWAAAGGAGCPAAP